MRTCATCGHPEDSHPFRHPFVGISVQLATADVDAELDAAEDARTLALDAAGQLSAMRDQLAADMPLPHPAALSMALGHMHQAAELLERVK